MVASVTRSWWVVVALLMLAAPSTAAAQRLQFFSTGLPEKAVVRDMAAGPDGAVWFSLNSRAIGRVAPDGTIALYGGLSAPATQIVLGADGQPWFIEPTVDRIGRISPAGLLVEYETSGILRSGTAFDSKVWGNLTADGDGVWISGRRRAAYVGPDGTVASIEPCDEPRPLIAGLGAYSAGALIQCAGDVDPPFRVLALSAAAGDVSAGPAPIGGKVRFLGPSVLFGVRGGDPEGEPRVLRRELPGGAFDRTRIQWPRRLLGDLNTPAAAGTDVWFSSRAGVSRTHRGRQQSAQTRYVARIDSSGETTPFYLDRGPWTSDCPPCPNLNITALQVAVDGAVWFADPTNGIGRLEPSAATVTVPERYLRRIARGRFMTLATENLPAGTRLVARWTPRRLFRTRRPLGPRVVDRARVRDGALRLKAPRRNRGFNLTISRGSVRLVDVDVYVGDPRTAP